MCIRDSIHCENMQEQFLEAIDQVFDKQIARVDDIINKLKMNKVEDNYESNMGVENSGETDKLNVNKACLLYTSRCV